MCLYTKETKLKTANENIICYKILLNYPSSTIFYTPYLYKAIMWTDIWLQKPIKAHGQVRKRKLHKDAPSSFNNGLIHTYQTITDAQASWLRLREQYKLFQCIIPKGTKYIDGHDDFNNMTYASKLIIIKQRII